MSAEQHITIRKLGHDELPPYDLLLLADPSKKMIDQYLESAGVYIAESGSNILGVYVLYPLSAKTVEIKNIAVAPDFQGRGLGKRLLDDASNTAKKNGFRTIKIGTANSSIRQLCLYQQQGFVINEIKKGFFLKNYETPIVENGIRSRHLLMLSKQL